MIVGLVLSVGAILKLFPSLAERVMGRDEPGRMSALDGLRGLLALCVFAHHGIIIQSFSRGLPWGAPTGNFDNLLGQASFALFFMISAYLFWGRVLKRDGHLDWISFFQGRVYRLAPMYFVTIMLLLIIVALETDFTLRVPIWALMKQIARWSSFTFFYTPDINGLKDTHAILSTIWTLRYEWSFYVALPVLASLYIKTGRSWPVYLVLTSYALLNRGSPVLFFAGGCLAADMLKNRSEIFQNRKLWAVFGICSLLNLTVWFHDMGGPIQALLLLPVFIASLQTSGIWRVFTWQPMRFLGHISYSVYLLHNPLLHLFVKDIVGDTVFAGLNPYASLGILFFCGLNSVGLSVLTFLYIEKPFLNRGRRILGFKENLAYAAAENTIQPAHARSQS
jgi:peptidoglycan/LPS O-acetylase OafA/YrhL